MKRVRVIISGKVQGVFFRARTHEMAQSLSLAGWVMNRADGSVEAVFEGKEDDLEAMLSWCRKGPAASRVTKVEVYDQVRSEPLESFTIRYF
ncbi:MAG: acylphosphatase [Deltaproteobacteria bacterium]|nr:acylphosphatase [Deltaproteobacteria bacterium]